MKSFLSKQSSKSFLYPYFRSIIPKDLVSNLGGATDFRLSLNYVRQEDRQILCLELKHITDEIFTEIREGMKTLSLEDIKDILRIEVRKQIKHTQHFALGTNEFDPVKKSKSIQNVSSRETKLRQELSGENIKEYEKELDTKLESILKSLEIEIETNSINYKNLRRKFSNLYLLRFDWIRSLINQTTKIEDEDTFRREVDEKLGLSLFPDLLTTQRPPVIENYAPEPSEPYQVERQETFHQSIPLNSLQSSPISKCIELYFGEKGHMRERSVQENRTSIQFLIHSFGDIPIGEITKEKSSILKSQLKQLPKNRTKNPKYRDYDFHELISMKIPKDESIHTTTINKYISNLSSFMNWCVNNGYSNTNTFTGMKITQKKNRASEERNRFTEQEIKTIFSVKDYLYTTKTYINKGKYANYWVPLIGLFTGMRANEICSLYLDNIREISGNHRSKRWCFDVKQEEDRPDKRLKNLSSIRIVPIHQTLLDLGFIDFLNLIKKLPDRKRVFEELPYKEGLYSRNISRFWNTSYLPKIGIKTDKNGFHSLRHSVIDHLKQKGIEPHFINELVGHSQGNIDLDRYGKGYNPDILFNKCVSKIIYETSNGRKVDFHSLIIDWKKIIV